MATDFELRAPPASPELRAQYLAVVVPFFGHVQDYPDGIVPCLHHIRALYQMRVKALHAAGWQEVQGKQLSYALNCPPCGVLSKPERLSCKRSICPFDFGRRVRKLYHKVRMLVNTQNCTVVTFRHMRGYLSKQRMGIYFDCDGDLSENVAEVLAEEQQYARMFRKAQLHNAIGGFHWHTVAPDTSAQGISAAAGGRWLRMHSCIAVMPPDWKASKQDVFAIHNPSELRLAKLVGNIFKYRPAWLYSDALIMAEYLNAVKRTRFLNPFGYFKRAPVNTD